MQLADNPESLPEGRAGDYFAGFLVNGFKVKVGKVVGRGFRGDCQESARVSPESTAARETCRNCFLALLVQVLCQVAR